LIPGKTEESIYVNINDQSAIFPAANTQCQIHRLGNPGINSFGIHLASILFLPMLLAAPHWNSAAINPLGKTS